MFHSGFRLHSKAFDTISLAVTCLLYCTFLYSKPHKVDIYIDGLNTGIVLEITENTFRLVSVENSQELLGTFKEAKIHNELLMFLDETFMESLDSRNLDIQYLFIRAIPGSFETFESISNYLSFAETFAECRTHDCLEIDIYPHIPRIDFTSQPSSNSHKYKYTILYNGQYKFEEHYLCLTGMIFRSPNGVITGNHQYYGQIKYDFDLTKDQHRLTKVNITINTTQITWEEAFGSPVDKTDTEDLLSIGCTTVAGTVLGYLHCQSPAGSCFGCALGCVVAIASANAINYQTGIKAKKVFVESANKYLLDEAKSIVKKEGLIQEKSTCTLSITQGINKTDHNNKCVVDEYNDKGTVNPAIPQTMNSDARKRSFIYPYNE